MEIALTKADIRLADAFLRACSRGDGTVVRRYGYAVVRGDGAEGYAHDGWFSTIIPDRRGDPALWWFTVEWLARTFVSAWN